MSETQKTIGEWAKTTFPGGDDLSPRHAIRLLEEVIEFCRATGASWSEIIGAVGKELPGVNGIWSRSPEPPAKVAAELADVEIVARVIAERRGIDLQEEVDLKMRINRERKWGARGDGTGYHIPDAT